jgi:starvation-inducible DNA-binding protein
MGRNHAPGTNPKLQFSIQPNIGLDSDARSSVIEILNTQLSDEAVLIIKTHCAFWNVRGPGFLDFRTLFDLQLNQLNKMSDEIAERVCMLGGFAVGSFVEFINSTRLGELPGNVPDIMDLIADHEASIRFLREDAKKCSEEHEDEGTRDFLVDILSQHEKIAWILRSYIEPELTGEEKRGTTLRPPITL